MVRLDNLREMLGYQSYIIEALALFAVLFYIAHIAYIFYIKKYVNIWIFQLINKI